MKNNFAVLLNFLPLLLLTSCEKEIKIDIPHSLMITVNMGNFSPDRGISNYLEGYIKESKKISDGKFDFYNIGDAHALIYENGILVDSLIKDPITFQFSGKFFSNKFTGYTGLKKYKISVSAPGYKDVFAEDIMPEKVPFTVTMIKNAKSFVIPERSTTPTLCDEINITFTDPPNSADFYSFGINRDLFNAGFLIFDADAEIEQGENDPGSVTVLKYGTLFMKDKNFNGKQKQVQLYVPSEASGSFKYILSSSHISENLYKYQRTYNKYTRTLGNAFAEPVLVFSNITNGAGIFGLQQQFKDTLR